MTKNLSRDSDDATEPHEAPEWLGDPSVSAPVQAGDAVVVYDRSLKEPLCFGVCQHKYTNGSAYIKYDRQMSVSATVREAEFKAGEYMLRVMYEFTEEIKKVRCDEAVKIPPGDARR